MTARYFKPIILASLLVLSQAQAAEGNLVANGSFERDPVTLVRYFGPNELSGWSADASIEVREGQGAEADRHFVELDAYRNGSMSQLLRTEAGQRYTLRFRYSNRSGTPVESNGLRVTVGDQRFDVPLLAPNHSGDNQWSEYRYTFTAQGNTLLTFTATGLSDAVGTSLDDVVVVPEGMAAPTQATAAAGLLAMMAALATIAWRQLRARRQGVEAGVPRAGVTASRALPAATRRPVTLLR